MQYRITKPSNLLNNHGLLIQKGYATSPILKYTRKDVAIKSRLKEWDYYLAYNNNYAVALTVGKSSSLLLISASFLDFSTKKEFTKTAIRFVSDRKLTMPESSREGDIIYQDHQVNITFRHINGKRSLTAKMKNFLDKEPLEVNLMISQEPEDSMVIATPFYEGDKLFFYNQKIIGMHTTGYAIVGNMAYHFNPTDSYCLLDWGRGIWPYHTTWYWSAAQGMIYDTVFGFNLGYGFGNTSAATENMIFYDGIANKLEDVTLHIPKNDKGEYEYLEPWSITSSDKRIEMTFYPIMDRSVNLSAIILSTNQHQVFGKFTGTAVLDDGSIIYLKDFLGFAERVENRW